jgi:murein DD-endopeptidase MepM/ murein hydrolase activator NlpD
MFELPIALEHPYPKRGRLSFGFQRTETHTHQGVDLVAPEGTIVRSVADGVVERVNDRMPSTAPFHGYGRVVIVRHADGLRSLYAHLHDVRVAVGQLLRQGEPVGTVGTSDVENSGAHLHFEVFRGSYHPSIESIDPGAFFFPKAEE